MALNIIYLIIANGIFNLLTLPITLFVDWLFYLRENDSSFWAAILIALLVYCGLIYLFFSLFLAFYKKRLIDINEQRKFAKIAFIALTLISLLFISTPVGIIANSFYLYGYFSVEHLLGISESNNIAYFLMPLFLIAENIVKYLCIKNKLFNYVDVSTNEKKAKALKAVKSKKAFKTVIINIVVASLIFSGLAFSYTVLLPYGYLFSKYGLSACECRLNTFEPVRFELSGNVCKKAKMIDSRWEFTRDNRVFNVEYTSGENGHFKHFIDDYQLEDIDRVVSQYLIENVDERIVHIRVDTDDIYKTKHLMRENFNNEFVVKYLSSIDGIVVYADSNNARDVEAEIYKLEEKLKNKYPLNNVIVVDSSKFITQFERTPIGYCENSYLTILGYSNITTK